MGNGDFTISRIYFSTLFIGISHIEDNGLSPFKYYFRSIGLLRPNSRSKVPSLETNFCTIRLLLLVRRATIHLQDLILNWSCSIVAIIGILR